MPTITHIFKTYFPDTQGGLEEAIRQIGKYSISKGFDVNVVSISNKPDKRLLDGICCYSYKYTLGISTMPISIDLSRQFKKIIDNTDIIQLHYPFPYAELLTLFHEINKPIIVTFHGEIEGRPLLLKCYHPFISRLFDKVDVIVPTSENLARSTPILREFRHKVAPINLWLDQERFRRLSDVPQDYKEQIASYGDYALFVGVLRWYKGLDILLNTAKLVQGNIVIVGKGPEKSHLQKRIEAEKLHNVFLLGYQSDEEVAYLFKQCRFFVLPSQTRGECFGQVLLEASYYRKAMISTELGTGTSLANKDKVTGFVVPPADTQVLSEKMNYLFKNPNKCSAFGDAAYVYYKSHFTEMIQGQKYIELYNRLLSEKR